MTARECFLKLELKKTESRKIEMLQITLVPPAAEIEKKVLEKGKSQGVFC
jgi:hypothetical protein